MAAARFAGEELREILVFFFLMGGLEKRWFELKGKNEFGDSKMIWSFSFSGEKVDCINLGHRS